MPGAASLFRAVAATTLFGGLLQVCPDGLDHDLYADGQRRLVHVEVGRVALGDDASRLVGAAEAHEGPGHHLGEQAEILPAHLWGQIADILGPEDFHRRRVQVGRDRLVVDRGGNARDEAVVHRHPERLLEALGHVLQSLSDELRTSSLKVRTVPRSKA